MLASKKLIAAFNTQIGHELAASIQYIGIASYFASEALMELSRFFYRQSDEEREHAMKFVRFIVDADGKIDLPAIPAPRGDFSSAHDAVKAALDWEEEVTQQIYQLVEIAKNDSNYIALRFLDWFVNEQFEEVNTMSELLHVVDRAGEDRLLQVEGYLAREKELANPHDQ